MRTVNLTCPIYWTNERKTKKSTTHLIGMNFYRNAHYHIQHKLKVYMEQALEASCNPPGTPFSTYKVTYTLYYKNPSCDASNVVALVEKALLDFAQAYGIVGQDNVGHHVRSTWKVGGQDKGNPRCEITITEVAKP